MKHISFLFFQFIFLGAIQNLPNLEKLQLSLLALQELSPNSLLNLPNLKHVRYIRYNQIEEIYEGVFNNLPLVILDLEGNGINYINENAFDDMSNLKELYLGKNNIKRINKNWFFNSPNLHKVFLEENAISKLPKKAFKQLEPHRQLSVNLSGNQIEEIFPRAFGNFKKFGHFDLSDNKISALPGNLFGINRIGGKYELDLRNNNINCLEKNIYAEVFSNCKRVLMQGNPITCDCSNTIERFFAKRGNGVEIFYEIDQNCQRRNK